MGLNLYMIGLTAENMSKTVEFYRRLGVTIPDGEEVKTHIEVKMPGELTFFLNSRPMASDNPDLMGTANGTYPILLEFYLKSQAAVEAKYAELVELGYQSYRKPFTVDIGDGMRFALVNDPDGHTILLSGDLDASSGASTES